MTNKEKFKEVFGLEIDDTSDCGFFDCTDRECKNCPVKDTKDWWNSEYKIEQLPSINPQEPKKCKDCKWWKDSDGLYRRGGHAESQCPINRREVFEGNGYCYMFEPQESEVNNG